jgi:sialate O-acetylesterase
MKLIPRLFILLICLLHGAMLLAGDLTLHPAFSSNMVLQRDQPVNVFGSGKPGASVSVSFASQTVSTTVQQDGNWKVVLTPLKVSTSPAVLTVKSNSEQIECTNVLVGDVWFCSGQSNMARGFNAFNQLTNNIASVSRPLVRIYITAHEVAKSPASTPLPPSKPKEKDLNQWQESKPGILMQASPLACFFADKVSDELHIPVGIMISCTGATAIQAYCPQELLTRLNITPPSLKLKEDTSSANEPSLCYNTYTHPYLDVTFKGFLWSQGESNADHPEIYRILFPAMIQTYRTLFHAENRPFYFMQLAPYGSVGWDTSKEAWAWLRESQAEALKLPKTGMTVMTDLGEFGDIHPQTKQAVGERLALFALRDEGKPVQPLSPMFKSMNVVGSKCQIRFLNTEKGLETRRVVMNKTHALPIQKDPEAFVVEPDKVQGFMICGEDHHFVEASAAIVGDHVEVWNDTIQKPIAVRYAWATFPLCNLFSKEGLPVSPFRTDDFPMPVLHVDKKGKKATPLAKL